jgi:hypothetical protein
MIIQQRQQNRRDLLKIATEIAREDWKTRWEIVSKRGGNMPPLTPFIHYHYRVLDALARGNFTSETVAELGREQEAVLGAYERANKEVADASR